MGVDTLDSLRATATSFPVSYGVFVLMLENKSVIHEAVNQERVTERFE